jgi:hypothetical protein
MWEAILGAFMSGVFVAALAFNYHGFIPPTDTSQQKDKSEQTDENSKDKSEQKAKSDKTDKGSSKKAASKKKTSACVTNCLDDWQFHSMIRFPGN